MKPAEPTTCRGERCPGCRSLLGQRSELVLAGGAARAGRRPAGAAAAVLLDLLLALNLGLTVLLLLITLSADAAARLLRLPVPAAAC